MRFLSLAAYLAMAIAQPSFAQVPTEVRDGSHDFDFSLGNWTTEVTIIKDPFDRPNEQIHLRGTKVARPVWGGKAWLLGNSLPYRFTVLLVCYWQVRSSQ